MTLHQLLEITIARQASDLHIVAGFHPQIRINGELFDIPGTEVITGPQVEQLIFPYLSPIQKNTQEVRQIQEIRINTPNQQPSFTPQPTTQPDTSKGVVLGTYPVNQQPQVIGAASTPITTLPKTGLPLVGIALAGLLPLGWKLKNLGSSKKDDYTPNSIWEEREFKK